jgi:hypothetical protein
MRIDGYHVCKLRPIFDGFNTMRARLFIVYYLYMTAHIAMKFLISRYA